MAPKSHFPRIVLVKSLADDCVPSLKDCIGKYTHIQSFNGIMLDGLNISDVTSIIQTSSKMHHIQLVVRYVHPINTLTHSRGLMGDTVPMTTPISPLAPSQQPPERSSSHETLPIPLMILGDMHVLCKELFKYLSSSERGLAKLQNTAENDFDSQVSARTGSNVGDSTLVVMTPNNTSTTASSLLVPSRPTRSETSVSSYDSHSYDGSDLVESTFQSDNYVRRYSVSRALFSNSNLSSPSTPIRTAGQQPPYTRQHTYPFVDKRYILNMFTQKMDRKFVHLFLRQSGMYLVVVSLEELMEDPIIQFENLSFWLRLVQTYVRPNGIKRVLIVGMSDGPATGERVQECLSNVEGAIQEAEYQHVYNRDGTSVIVFDRKNPRASVERLCVNISKCMDVTMTRSWHMHRPFFESVFQPFQGLTEVLSSLSRRKDMLLSSDALQSMYQYADLNYYDTLAAYSSALISDRRECQSVCGWVGMGGWVALGL